MGCGASRVPHIFEPEHEVQRRLKRARKPTCKLGVTLEFLERFLQHLDEGFFQGDGDFTTDDL
eukprot:59685-Prorocentrum_minimum.AAC.1